MKSISHFSDSIQTQKYFFFQTSTLLRIWGRGGVRAYCTDHQKNTFAHSLTCNSQLARGGIFVCLASNLSSILKVGVLSMENLVALLINHQQPWKSISSSFHQRQSQLFHPLSWFSCHLWGLPKLENNNGHSKRIIPLAYHSPTPSNNDCCVLIRKWWPPVPGNFCVVRFHANLKLAPTKEKNFCSFSITWETKNQSINFQFRKKSRSELSGMSYLSCSTTFWPFSFEVKVCGYSASIFIRLAVFFKLWSLQNTKW